LLAIVGIVVVTQLILSSLLALALGLPLYMRVSVAVIAVAPLGLALGVPFPTGLQLVRQQVPQLVPWAWAVNGFFTVIGSIGAMILGMILGFAAVFFIAAACYAVGLLAIRMTVKRPAGIESRSPAASS